MEQTARDAVIEQRFMHAGETTEGEVWRRVADAWANTLTESAEFEAMMAERRGFPNTPAIANAGRDLNQGSACFVLPIDDSVESIMQTAKDAALVHKSGGGTGFSFGRIRGKGERVSTTGRPAPGPVSFLNMYSDIFRHVTQGGLRPGANMGILPVDHPDIWDFIHCKRDNHDITNFNISVGITDDFMRRLDSGDADAGHLWAAILHAAHSNGEPGVVYLDTMNNTRLHPEMFEATNPCGEVPLLPYEACVLGSINLAAHVTAEPDDDGFDYKAFRKTVRTMVRLLDNIIDKQSYPLPIIEETHKRYRKIGVGVMGYADALVLLGYRYGSPEALEFAESVAYVLSEESYLASEDLGMERGVFPGNAAADAHSPFDDYRRNLCTTVIAPTGTISRLAGCSFGIEPHFAAAYDSYILGGVYPEVSGYKDSPHFTPTASVTAEQHVLTQAAFQKYVDQAVSKTVNLPASATIEDVDKIYRLAYTTGCKGITVLRDQSREDVVIDCSTGVCPL